MILYPKPGASGRGNPIQRPLPPKAESELPGSPAGLVPPLSREYCRCSPCTVTSLPGEHLFQASALPRNRMRPAIFHAFGKAKTGAQAALRELELQGWETLPIATLGMPPAPSMGH